LRCAAQTRPGSKLGRIDESSAEIGFANSNVSSPAPKIFACSFEMKDQVMASANPCAAKERLEVRARF
jgi:hypothetical protein